ncbi:hypothetical protein [Streptosporangium amethystogenes]|uniref:hypothetical protein n=1 Tax=Streptosporangium amethystogenes TaxID=2002 RepID=UPI0004C71E87|nr:hypothetical protein [Streptosporangium amethystogenes]
MALVVAVVAWSVLQPRWPDVAGTAKEEIVSVDSSTRAAFLEAADRFLETDPDRVGNYVLASDRPDLSPRVFCHEEFVEVRRKNRQLLLGIVAACQELARSGPLLVGGSGYRTVLLLTVESVDGRLTVRQVEEPLDGDLNIPSVREMFSPRGAPRALELVATGSGMHDVVEEEAREVFGLPSDTDVTYITELESASSPVRSLGLIHTNFRPADRFIQVTGTTLMEIIP